MLTGNAPDAVPGKVRTERALLLLSLTSRTAYLLYAAAVVAVNLRAYERPGLAGAALAVALAASAGLGALVWRTRAVSGRVAVADGTVALVVLFLVAAAIRPPGQSGALNWALAYAVACAMWLGFGSGMSWRFCLACVLGAAYAGTALRGGVDPARAITVVVNAASVPMYFGIAAAIAWVMRRIAAEMAAEHALEQRQRRDLAALAERERLCGQVHQSVLATLELIAKGEAPWAELRGRARAQVLELRGAFRDPGETGARQGLGALLTSLATDRAREGWAIEMIDEEMASEPGTTAACALRDALAELVAGPAPSDRPVRARLMAGSSGAEMLIRIPREKREMAGPVARAQARLAVAGGTAGWEPAVAGEVRVRLRVPA